MKKTKNSTRFQKGFIPWNKGLKGDPSLKRSEETRRKISEANKGRSSWLKGKHHSEETRSKISASNMGRAGQLRTGELNGMYSKKQSTQTKLKISAALKLIWKQRQRKKL